MVSAKTILLMAALVGLCVANPMKRQADKCDSTEESQDKAMTAFLDCFVEVNGKEFNMEDVTQDDFTPEKGQAIVVCILKELGTISEDGSTFNVDAAKTNIDEDVIADPALKDQMKAGVDECVAKGGEALDIAQCVGESSIKICS